MTDLPTPLLPWTRWTVPGDVAVALATILAAYLAGLGPLRPAHARAQPIERRRVVAFLGGLLVLFLALTGPLGDLAGTFLFSAHMVQHLILTLAVPPLLLFGTPGWLIRPALLRSPLAPLARGLTRPMIAFAAYSLMLLAWHLPLLYNVALASRPVHGAMHIMFVAAAVLGWWPLLSPLPELPRLALPLQLLYLLIFGIPMVLVAALVTLADQVLYPHYAAAPRLWGLSPLEDQRIGGLIMWVPAHAALIGPFTIVFFRWAQAEADDEA